MINVDAAFDETKGSGSSGANIRDTQGAFITASHSFIPHILVAPSAEAAALRDRLLLAQQIGCNCVKIQSDYMEVVQMMHNGGSSAMAAVAFYDEIIQLGRLSLPDSGGSLPSAFFLFCLLARLPHPTPPSLPRRPSSALHLLPLRQTLDGPQSLLKAD